MIKLAIHSVPRSGSTWLGALIDAHPNIVYKYQPLFSYAFKGALNEDSTLKEIDTFFSSLAVKKDDFLDQNLAKENGLTPEFSKKNPTAILYKEVRYHNVLANLMEKDQKVKVVGLIRDPRAVLYSWWKAPKEFDLQAGWKFEDEWFYAQRKNKNRKEEFYGYAKWKETTQIFLELSKIYPNRFILTKYSDLLSDTYFEVCKLMNFFGLEADDQQVNFIESSKNRHNVDAYSVYKVKRFDTNWEKNLPTNISEFIVEDLKGTTLEEFIR